MGRNPKRRQSSDEVSVILFDIKQNLKWPKNFIKTYKYETFHENSAGVAMIDKDEKTDMTKLRITICNYSVTTMLQKWILMPTTKFNICMYLMFVGPVSLIQ